MSRYKRQVLINKFKALLQNWAKVKVFHLNKFVRGAKISGIKWILTKIIQGIIRFFQEWITIIM